MPSKTAKLIKEYPDKTQDELEKSFKGCSYHSIQRKANALRLKKSKIWAEKQRSLNSSFKTKEVNEMDMKKVREKELLEEISRRGFMSVKREIKQDLVYSIRFGNKEKIAVVSDTHLGSCKQQLHSLRVFYALCQKRGITKVLHCGDMVEGNGKQFNGQIYEMFLHGADAMVEYAIQNYPKIKGITTYVIGGNHDYSFYKESGDDVLKRICEKRQDIRYLGMSGAYIKFGNIKVYMMHGDSGSAYARSYRLQKICEQFSPEQKPNILLLGHYHQPCYLSGYRNIEALQLPCFQAQTHFLKAKGIYPFVAGTILEWTKNKKGLTYFRVETIPFYEIREGDF
jgi:predicted phosphodiesterase